MKTTRVIRIGLALLLVAGAAPTLTAAPVTTSNSSRTRVSIADGQWRLNGAVTYRGAKAEGRGKVGPDLTSIGQVRSERDLLEAIVYPSATLVRSYESVLVITKAGDEHSGDLREDAPDEVLLATGPTTEVRIARSDIAEVRPGTVSVMPQGMDEQLSRQELADLLAFLKNTEWGPQ